MNEPTFISLFSGIGGADLGFERAGWKCVAQVESNPWRREVLATHFPGVPQFDDVCTVGVHNLPRADLIVGGFPCQDLSVAGKRVGLAGERSGLFFEFARILSELRPAWCLIENVPGLLSSNQGRDFAVVLYELAELGYGLAWRILDSQHFGVPQRRRRVFIVGCLGRACPPEVLFEPEGSGGDIEEGEEEGKGTARGTKGSPRDGEPWVLPGTRTKCRPEQQTPHRKDGHSYALNTSAPPVIIPTAIRLAQTSSNGCGISEDGIIHTLDGTGGDAICAPNPDSGLLCGSSKDSGEHRLPGGAITNTQGRQRGQYGSSDAPSRHGEEAYPDRVREASRIPRQLDYPDTPRYQALGDAMTVNVLEWIARRIKAVIPTQT